MSSRVIKQIGVIIVRGQLIALAMKMEENKNKLKRFRIDPRSSRVTINSFHASKDVSSPLWSSTEGE